MNTIIFTLQTTSKTADQVKKTAIAEDKHQNSKPFFKQIIKNTYITGILWGCFNFMNLWILKNKTGYKDGRNPDKALK